MSKRDDYIDQRLHDTEDRDNQLQIVPSMLFLAAILIFALGQPIVAGVVLLTAILLSATMSAGVRQDAELAVDVYMEGRPDRERVTGHFAIVCHAHHRHGAHHRYDRRHDRAHARRPVADRSVKGHHEHSHS